MVFGNDSEVRALVYGMAGAGVAGIAGGWFVGENEDRLALREKNWGIFYSASIKLD